MHLYYSKFPRHPVSDEQYKMILSNNIISIYYYRVDPNLVKFVFEFVGFDVYVQPVLLNLINIGYHTLIHQLNQYIPLLKTVTIKNTWALQILDLNGIIRQ